MLAPEVADAATDDEPFGSVQRSDPCRPGDQLEPWWIDQTRAVRALAQSAACRRLPVDTAIALLIEIRFALDDVADATVAVVDALDEIARQQRVEGALPGSYASYLRTLTHGADAAEHPLPDGRITVALPVRLGARLARAGGPAALLEPHRLDQAIAWEIAAVIEGRTIGEWAAWHALSCCR